LGYSDFETEEEFREEVLLQIKHNKETSLIQDLPIPPVDTDIIYTSAIDATIGEFVKKDNLLEKGEAIISGGDGTVPTWSTLLVGLKWIFDKKKNDLPQNIRLVEYCSRLNKDFPYKESSNFIALGCKCLDKKTNSYENDFEDCNHQKMLLDPDLISYLYKIISNDTKITEDRKKAIEEAFEEKDYENICNLKLLNYSNVTYDSVILESHCKKIILIIVLTFYLIIIIINLSMQICESKCCKEKCGISCFDCFCCCISCYYCCDKCSFNNIKEL
jgi:hypothetical protein